MSGLFARQITANFEEVAVDQCGVPHEVATLHAGVEAVIKTENGEKRDNELLCDAMHALGDPLDPTNIVS